MRFWSNCIGYQLVWFCTVIAAAHGSLLPGILAFAAFCGWQLAISRDRGADLKLLGSSILLGVLIDGSLALAGWTAYATPAPSLPPGGAPVWILCLWASFAMTLNETLIYLQRHLWVAAIFGAVGGPLAYLGAARAWHAVAFAAPASRGIAALSFAWGIALPALAALARHWSQPSKLRARTQEGSP
jgi:hypothetical protein